MYLCTVLRSSPIWRAIAETLTPCRCNSRIITTSPSPTNDGPSAWKGAIISPNAADPWPQAPLGSFGEYPLGAHTLGLIAHFAEAPVQFIGLNRDVHLKLSSEAAWHRLGDR